MVLGLRTPRQQVNIDASPGFHPRCVPLNTDGYGVALAGVTPYLFNRSELPYKQHEDQVTPETSAFLILAFKNRYARITETL